MAVLMTSGGVIPSTLPPIGTPLNNLTWEQISEISNLGLASSYFSIGDKKAITLNGTVGTVTFTNETYYAYIIGIDHNADVEGKGIHFQFGFDALSGGANIAFVEAKGVYNTDQNAGEHFNMDNKTRPSGGWGACRMRNTIIPHFKNILPSDFLGILKTVTKYTDNVGGGDNKSSNVTTTEDDIFLLAEFEVQGTRINANSSEKNYQKQYDYYKSGNSKVRQMHRNTNNTSVWWTRSIVGTNASQWTGVGDTGASYNTYCYRSLGFAPAFMV